MIFPMHIARIVHIYKGDLLGDTFNAHELSLRQSNTGHNITLLTWNKNNRKTYSEINDKFHLYRLPGMNLALKPFFTEYPFLPTLNSQLSKINPDVVHAHSHLFLPTYQAMKSALKFHTPLIVTIHGVSAYRDFLTNAFQKAYMLTFCNVIFHNSSRIICLTNSDANQIISFGCPRDKIVIIPNPVDVELFSPMPMVEEENTILWTGRFVSEKGLRSLIEAAEIAYAQNKNLRFILVGTGPLKTDLEVLISQKGLSNCISLIGPLNHTDVAKIIQKSSLFVFPSLKEGMSRSVLEAMSCQKAVVAMDIPGMDEIIQNGYNGVLLDPQNPIKLSETILQLVSDQKLRNRLGRNARNTILHKFTWKNHLNSLTKVYESA